MNKTQKKAECSRILNFYHFGDTVQGVDEKFLISIFENHPRWIEGNYGGKFESFSIRKSRYGGKEFVTHLSDGKIDVMSFNVALKGARTPKATKNLKQACRAAILPEVFAVREKVNFGVDTCPLSGEVLTEENVHIDHYDMDFRDVFSAWLESCPWSESELLEKITDPNRADIQGSQFTDSEVASHFVKFHNANTHLRAVTKTANLKRGRK